MDKLRKAGSTIGRNETKESEECLQGFQPIHAVRVSVMWALNTEVSIDLIDNRLIHCNGRIRVM